MKRYILSALVVFLFVFSIIMTAQEDTTQSYRIGARDLLEISVYGQQDLDRRARVSEEGKIIFPLIGEVDVEGLTVTELEAKLARLLEKDYLQNAQVTVFILEYQSKRVSVIGAVPNPGSYELIGRQTLVQLISRAGGFTSEAGEEVIVIRQYENGSNKTLKISLEGLMIEGDASLDIPLQPDDRIIVPEDKLIKIYVYGKVNNPGALEVKKSNIPTLTQAIAQAGGFAERASKGSVQVTRIKENGEEEIIKVNVKDIQKGKRKNIQLQENDTVYVPETIF